MRYVNWMLGLMLAVLAITVIAQDETPAITPDNAADLTRVYQLNQHRDAISTLVFTEEYALNTIGLDNWWYVWDLRTGSLSTPQRNSFGQGIFDFAVEVAPDEEVINALVVERRRRSNAVIATTTNQLTILPFESRLVDIQLLPDMSRAVTASEDGSVAVWDVESGDSLANWTLEAMPLALSIDDAAEQITVVAADGVVTLPLDGGAVSGVWDAADAISVTVGAIRQTEGGRLAALARSDESLVVVDVATGEAVFTVEETPAIALDMNTAGTLLAVSLGESVVIFDIASGEQLVTLSPEDRLLTSVAFSTEDFFLVAGGESGVVYVWGAPN
jgi:WD40 repeat protein